MLSFLFLWMFPFLRFCMVLTGVPLLRLWSVGAKAGTGQCNPQRSGGVHQTRLLFGETIKKLEAGAGGHAKGTGLLRACKHLQEVTRLPCTGLLSALKDDNLCWPFLGLSFIVWQLDELFLELYLKPNLKLVFCAGADWVCREAEGSREGVERGRQPEKASRPWVFGDKRANDRFTLAQATSFSPTTRQRGGDGCTQPEAGGPETGSAQSRKDEKRGGQNSETVTPLYLSGLWKMQRSMCVCVRLKPRLRSMLQKPRKRRSWRSAVNSTADNWRRNWHQ